MRFLKHTIRLAYTGYHSDVNLELPPVRPFYQIEEMLYTLFSIIHFFNLFFIFQPVAIFTTPTGSQTLKIHEFNSGPQSQAKYKICIFISWIPNPLDKYG